MSNRALVQKALATLEQVRSGKMSTKDAAHVVGASTTALECLPYELIKKFSGLVDLDIAHWNEEQGGFPDIERTLLELEACLQQVPLDI